MWSAGCQVRGALCVGLVVVSVLVAAPSGREQAADAITTYLRDTIGLSTVELRRMENGLPVARTLNGRGGQEVVTFGVIRIDRPPAEVFTFLGSVDALRSATVTQAAGTLSAPPHPADFAGYSLHPDTVSSLETCRVGACAVQLPAAAITRFHRDVPWRTPQALEVATRLIRELALGVVTAYQTQGHSTLPVYDDKRPPTAPSAEYARALASAEYLPAPLSALREYISRYPHRPTPGIRDQFVWSLVDFGMKPTFRITHRIIADGQALDDPSGHLVGAVASVQLLATHYFSSHLQWHFVVRHPGATDHAHVYQLARSWAPGLTGLRGHLSRSSARGQGREAMETYLRNTKHAVETRQR